LISPRILISAADFGGKKMHLGIKISKKNFWIVKILSASFDQLKKVYNFCRFFQCGGGDGFLILNKAFL
jgi:hypothetical protein